jgi:LysM repeat protein
MKRTSTRIILLGLMLILALTGCQRSASVNPGIILQELPTLIETTGNKAQEQISATQTEMKILTTTPKQELIKSPTSTTKPEVNTTPVDIIATITPTMPITPTVEEVILPTITRPSTYVIQENENPYCIARRFNVDIGELLSLNILTTESQPTKGTTLKIPSTNHPWSSGPIALLPHPTQYTVRNGDTLSGIACLFGDVSPEAIIFVNKMTEPVTLQGGTVINIP